MWLVMCVFLLDVFCRTPTGNHTGQLPANFAQAPFRGRLRLARYARLHSVGPGKGTQIVKSPITEETLHPPFIGSYSHVVLDSIMHTDIEPLSPFSQSNELLGFISVGALHKFCIYSGLVGAVLFFAVNRLLARHNNAFNTDAPKRRAG